MTISVSLTKKQFENLVKLVHLGNWMANSFRAEGKRLSEFDDLERHVLSFAEEAGYGRRVSKDASGKDYRLSETLEDEIHQHSNRYDDDVFWDTLVELLALRDMREEYGKKELDALSDEEYAELAAKAESKYEAEFDRHGVERLAIDKG